MGMLPAILFYGLLATFVMSFLLTLLNEEMSDFFYLIFDSITHQASNIIEFVKR